MKLPFLRKPSQQSTPQQDDDESSEEEPNVEHSPVDITVPRACIYQSFHGKPGPCPHCGGTLQQSYQTYLIVTRRGEQTTDSFITGTDFGWFCTNCPTVVINPDDVSRMVQTPLPHWDVGDQFVILGIVNMDAIPAEKRDRTLGDDDNPIPLIGFTNVVGAASRRRKPKSRARRR